MLILLLGPGLSWAADGRPAAHAEAEQRQQALREALDKAAAEHAQSTTARMEEEAQLQALLRKQAALRTTLRALQARIESSQSKLASLDAELAKLQAERSLALQRLQDLSALFARARSARGGAQGALAAARGRAWLQRISLQRADLLRQIDAANRRQQSLRATQAAEQQALLADQATQAAEDKRLHRLASEHRAMLAQLDHKVASDSARQQSLQQRMAEVEQLLDRLRRIPQEAKPVQLRGLAGRKGKLDWPLRGKVLRRFGAQTSSGNSDGTLVALEEGQEVPTIADATVAWVGWLPQRGLVILLDHGQDYFSLYGHAAGSLYGVGDEVPAGAAVIRSGRTGGLDQPAVYFELRQGRQALNPRSWFRNPP